MNKYYDTLLQAILSEFFFLKYTGELHLCTKKTKKKCLQLGGTGSCFSTKVRIISPHKSKTAYQCSVNEYGLIHRLLAPRAAVLSSRLAPSRARGSAPRRSADGRRPALVHQRRLPSSPAREARAHLAGRQCGTPPSVVQVQEEEDHLPSLAFLQSWGKLLQIWPARCSMFCGNNIYASQTPCKGR